MKFDAVIFDFDGVIIDTETARFQAWKKIFNYYDQELPFDIWTKSIGHSVYVVNPFDLLKSLSGKEINNDEIKVMEHQYQKEFVAQKPIMPGIIDRILEAKESGAKIAVASSASRNWVEGHLRDRNIFHHFDATVCSNDVANCKPHPEPYITALNLLNAQASNSFAVEDSPTGIEAAVSAGIFCLAIKGQMTRNLDLSRANLIIESLEEITFNSLLIRKISSRFPGSYEKS